MRKQTKLQGRSEEAGVGWGFLVCLEDVVCLFVFVVVVVVLVWGFCCCCFVDEGFFGFGEFAGFC